jgi:DNA-binding NarL/FixJ family response regulator
MYLKMLLLETNPIVSQGLTLSLEEHFPDLHCIGIAQTEIEALAHYETHEPHLVIFDIRLVEGDIFDFLKAINSKRSKSHFLCLSQSLTKETRRSLESWGIQHFLQKTSPMDHIVEIISPLLAKAKKKLTH